MQLYIIPVEDIIVPQNRQRKYFNDQQIQDLAASITQNGLIQPLVIRHDEEENIILVAGERRLRALDIVWGFGEEVVCGDKIIPDKHVPCLYLGEIDPIDAFEIELEENIRRTDLDWKEKAQAIGQLYELRCRQAERAGAAMPSVASLAEEIKGSSEGAFQDRIKEDLILSRNLDNPVVAKAATRSEAFKALKRDEESKRNEELGKKIGKTFSAAMHTLRQGNCLEILPELPSESFEVILTDPPYGIGANEFGDSDGKTAGAHFYDDSAEYFQALMPPLSIELYRVAKPQAHLYLFCDIEWFLWLRTQFQKAEWKVFRTPFIWINPTAMRAPWPLMGPQRKWQMVLYAVKGNKTVNRLYSDTFTYPSDANLGHQAQKPVAVYLDLLRRSVRPGDKVLDPFCGTGTIFSAAHQVTCAATGIELDPAAAGIAAKRLGELK